MRRRAVAIGMAATLLLVPAVFGASAAAAPVGCTPAANVEAIVDDSLSMQVSDPDRLRVQGLDLLLETLPPSTTLGAIEFGSAFGGLRPPASPIFAPAPIGPDATAMKRALRASIKADDGLTDYNGAFALSDSENPAAQARVFLTDGGHNEGEYTDAHLVHNVPTYVIGFGAGLSGAEDKARLRRIAGETGGRYYQLADSGRLGAALNLVGSRLTCEPPPRTFTDELAAGRTTIHTVAIGATTRSVRIALTWASPRDRFRLSGVRLVPAGKASKPRSTNVDRQGGVTFSLIEVSGLERGELRFSVRAAKIGSGERKPTLTTQVTQQRR